jgi:hypothetical protein
MSYHPSIEPQNCPFCKRKSELQNQIPGFVSGYYVFVQCSGCMANGPHVFIDNNCRDDFLLKDDAIEKWNTRFANDL